MNTVVQKLFRLVDVTQRHPIKKHRKFWLHFLDTKSQTSFNLKTKNTNTNLGWELAFVTTAQFLWRVSTCWRQEFVGILLTQWEFNFFIRQNSTHFFPYLVNCRLQKNFFWVGVHSVVSQACASTNFPCAQLRTPTHEKILNIYLKNEYFGI